MKKYFSLYIVLVSVFILVANAFSQTPRPTVRPSWYEEVQWILTGSETLTNKTLTSPTITSPTISGTITNSSTNTFSGALNLTQVNAASGSANPFDYTGTLGIMNGSDNFTLFDVNLTNDDHTGSSNYVYIMDIANITGDAHATENAIQIGTGWDLGLVSNSAVEINGTVTLANDETIDNSTDGTVNVTAGVLKHGYDSAAYWTATQADGGAVTFNSTSDGTAGFVFSDPVEINAAVTLANDETIDNATDGTVAVTAGVFKQAYDANAYWTATQADAGNVTFNSTSDGTAGFVFSDAVEINAGVTLENDEIVANATDGEVTLTFDDNAATLGELVMTTSLTKTALDPDNHFDIVFNMKDGDNNDVDWVKIISTVTDTVNNSKDSKIGFQVYTADAASVPLELTGNTLTLDQGATIVNSGADSLVITEAGSRFLGSMRVSGTAYARAAEINGSVVLANDEYVSNATDAEVKVVYDDDAATLGEFVLTTSLTKTALDPNNHVDIVFTANDGANNAVDWTKIVSTMTDTAAASKDSKIGFTTYKANSAVTGLELTGKTLTLGNAETVDNETDGDVIVTYDDDAATLGELILTTSLTKTALDPDNHMDVVFRANDGDNNSVDWTKIVSTMTDTVNNSKDSKIGFTTYAANSAVTGLEITGGTLTLSNGTTLSSAHTDTTTITETAVKIKGGLTFAHYPTVSLDGFGTIATESGHERAYIRVNGVNYYLIAVADSAAIVD